MIARTSLPLLACATTLPLLLAACGSAPPTNYFTLASSAADPVPGATATAPIVVALGPVKLPDYVDRPQIVLRESEYTVRLADNDQWAAPLADMLPRIMVEDLARRLPGDRVVGFPQVAGPNFDYRVALDIGRFDVDAAGNATIAAQWQVYAAGSPRALIVEQTTARRTSPVTSPGTGVGTGTGGGAGVQALSSALGDLSQRIADSVQAVRTTAPRPITSGIADQDGPATGGSPATRRTRPVAPLPR